MPTFFEALSLAISSLALLVVVYAQVIRPRLAPKPDLVYSADHYFITDKAASHDFMIWNKGTAPARNVGLEISFKPPFKVLDVFSSPPFERIEGEKENLMSPCIGVKLLRTTL